MQVLILLLFTVAATSEGSIQKTLVLVSFDGFRYDTLNKTIAPSITEWAEKGTIFKNGVASQAITYTAPNHMSIVTGLYEDSHGIVGNFFFDSSKLQFYDIYNASTLPGIVQLSQRSYWYDKGEPIWESVRKTGGRSTVMHWPVGDVQNGNKTGTVFYPWDDHGDLPLWKQEVDRVIEEINQGSNFVAWYVSEPDHILHTHGFYYNNEYRIMMEKLDKLFEYFIGQLKEKGLFDHTDVILTADHGHSEIKGLESVLCLDDYITGTLGVDYHASENSVHAFSENQAIEIYENLTRAVKEKNIPVKVLWKKDIPSWWHFGHPSRVGQIVVQAEIGGDARFRCHRRDPATFHSSTHGMSPKEKEMRALLVMRGPSFAEGRMIDSIPQNIDLYPLMTTLMNTEIAPNNGTMHIVKLALRTSEYESREEEDGDVSMNPLWIVAPSIVIFTLLAITLVLTRRHMKKKSEETSHRRNVVEGTDLISSA